MINTSPPDLCLLGCSTKMTKNQKLTCRWTNRGVIVVLLSAGSFNCAKNIALFGGVKPLAVGVPGESSVGGEGWGSPI